MSRYIDADALIEHITNTADLGGWIGEALQQIKKVAIKYINLAPTIDIVRCKECRFSVNVITSWSANGENKRVERLCKVNSHNVNDNDFCSYGEREGE